MPEPLPHDAVYARLGRSKIHGIGVFAIRPIPAGARLFADDAVAVTWVDEAALERAELSQAQRALYRDFGIRRGALIGCPESFNNLGPSWYLNEPAAGTDANVRCGADFEFVAGRDIAEGEELTIDYASFSRSEDD